MIDKATVEKIKNAADIVEVVSDYVHLIRRGANYMGLCPFHNERTPSFSVSRSRNMCYCFSCKKGGSPVNFIMLKEGINYHDALLHLAAKYGIKVEEREMTDEERQRQSERENMLTANSWALEVMQKDLTETQEGRNVGLQYFYQRGVSDRAIKAFRLGYAIDRGDHLSGEARKAGYDFNVLHSLGLLGKSKEGRYYDRFRGRVIFPILNSAGKVIAFGGRDLKGGLSKYINSPESDLYKKSNELYGIYQAKSAMVKQDKCFLVEGYLDVIGMWESGMENTVASSGTALTDGQIALIHRFTNNVTLLYDGDAAGIKAALRGVDMLLTHNLDVKVLVLPDGEDPDSFSRKHSPEEFRRFVEANETDVIRFKAKVLLDDAGSDPIRKSAAIHDMVKSLASISDRIKRNVYIEECSRMMGIDEKILMLETAKASNENVSRMRKEREQRRQHEELDRQNGIPASETGKTATPAELANTPESTLSSAMKPLEKELIRYCIRYGMLDVFEGSNEAGELVYINVAEYIGDELADDELEFSFPLYSRTFDAVRALKDRFTEDMARNEELVKTESEHLIADERALIAEKGLSMEQLDAEEKRIEAQAAELAAARRDDFAAGYVGKILASCEDDDMRQLALECLHDPDSLSKYHQKTGVILSERERLEELVPRAVTEFKEGIISMKIASLNSRLKEAEADGDRSLTLGLLSQIHRMTELRKNFALLIGERIISPKKFRNISK